MELNDKYTKKLGKLERVVQDVRDGNKLYTLTALILGQLLEMQQLADERWAKLSDSEDDLK